jgi:fermentation-respiration switch protein FrsA (DUF1100 family)
LSPPREIALNFETLKLNREGAVLFVAIASPPMNLLGPALVRDLVALIEVIADHDHVAITDLELTAYERALEPKRLVLIKGGHFDPYLGQFEQASGAAIDWFRTHLAIR